MATEAMVDLDGAQIWTSQQGTASSTAAGEAPPLVLLHGGHCTDALLQTVTALDAHSLEVVFTEDAPEARVAHAGVCVGGSSLIVFGGTNMLHPPAHDDCLMFDTGSKQWYWP